MGETKSFSAKSASSSSASVNSRGKIKPYKPDTAGVEKNFAATVVLRPSWLKAEHEDAYLLGMLLKIMTKGGMRTRSELCKMVFEREVISEEEDEKLNRAMWELNRLGIIKLHNLKVDGT